MVHLVYLVGWDFHSGFLDVTAGVLVCVVLTSFVIYAEYFSIVCIRRQSKGLPKVCLYVMFDAFAFSGIFLKLVRHLVFLVLYSVFPEVIFCDGFSNDV